MIKYTDLLKLCIVASLILNPVAQAAPKANGNGNSSSSSSGNSNGNGNSGGNGGQSGAVNDGATSGGSTTGLNGGNNGNGVGNTGPGNQGNDSSVGNAGGTTGSSTGGSSSGSSSNGSSGGSSTGSSDNGNTGGFSGGNNGNGVGNTGPGNQGNDTSNGNAGGTTGSSTGGSSTGNSNGGNNGNANGGASGGSSGNSDNGNTGGFSGGNNGNGVGNTGPGNQGNDTDNGNAGGTTGSTNGGTTGSTSGGTTGSTSGGESTGSTSGGESTGSTSGGTTGSTSGGESTGSTSGGESTGSTSGGESTGSTSGGESTGGESTGGESTGGESTGGESTGGETGETSGGETGETSGGETGETSGGTSGETTEAKPKEKFKVRLLPLAFGNYDIANRAVNLTPADERDVRNNDARLDVYENGFLVSQLRQYDGGLGAMPMVYLENATGLASLATGMIGLALTKGKYIQYERFVEDERDVDGLKTLPLPLKKKTLDLYLSGESAYFESMGGVLFMAGPGVAGAYAGGSVLAEGGFRTLVKKTDRGAVVQLVRAKVRTASLFTGAAVLKLDATRVKQLNEGFNYEFDFARGGNVAVKAFEQLVAGNVTLAQENAKNAGVTGVTRISESKNREITKKRGISLGIPMVAMMNWTAGKIYGETATKTYADRTTTDLNYGVYFKEEKGRFFHKHKKITRAFYSSKAVTKDEKSMVLAENEEANFFWSYENDAATSGSLNSAMTLFHKDLGLKSQFNPAVERGEKLRFVRLEASVKVPETYIKKLITESLAGRGRGEMQRDAQNLISQYFRAGDELNLCKDEDDVVTPESECAQKYLRESTSAINRIQASLSNLKDKRDSAAYTFAVALMGKELVKNQFVMNAFFAQDKSCSVKFDVKLEGRRLSRMMKSIPANKACR